MRHFIIACPEEGKTAMVGAFDTGRRRMVRLYLYDDNIGVALTD